jgi:hypothetical protein
MPKNPNEISVETVTSFKAPPPVAAVTIAVHPEEDIVNLTVDSESFSWDDEVGDTDNPYFVPAQRVHGVGVELTFTATPYLEFLGTEPVDYRWDMGDGIIRFGPVVTHTFLTPNPNAIVRLTLIDSKGNRARAFKVMNLRVLTPIGSTADSHIVVAEAIVLG